MRAVCTIITSNYFPYAAALYRSLIKFHSDEKLVILVCDEGPLNFSSTTFPGIEIIRLKAIMSFGETECLYSKYYRDNIDAFRWSMKPVLLSYLLKNGYEKVMYVDCDIFFFNDYDFLFDELNSSSVLLTPCWRTIDYKKNEEEFISLYTDGLYNAGFIAAGKKGILALEWWTQACFYKIAIDYKQGLFVDQRYLDAMPVMFPNIKAIEHKGCNISVWNQHECKRILVDDKVLINGKDPIVFIHFNNNYIKELLEGRDHLLFPHLKQYEATFNEPGYRLSDFISGLPEHKEAGALKKFKHKTLLRTRMKNFLHKLIDKI
jgi:hypothetical protein